MSFHHIAIATRDMHSTHEFYTKAMGFELVRVEKAQTGPEAWAKHFFYDTGDGEMMAFWEIHDNTLDPEFPTSISEGLGLPRWSNHIAFGATSQNELDQARERINAAGYDVVEIDHHWCKSIYVDDPNGIMVEFCVSTRAFDDNDRRHALAALNMDELADEPAPIVTMHKAN
jgi:catechol 2,3-dioxygenase-like lactoylglutathione lyase family enzyme